MATGEESFHLQLFCSSRSTFTLSAAAAGTANSNNCNGMTKRRSTKRKKTGHSLTIVKILL